MPKPRRRRSPFLEGINCKVDVFYFVNPKGKCPVEDDFLNDLKAVTKKQKSKIAALIIRYAEKGKLKDEQLHRLKGRVRNFWVIKSDQHRLCFFKEGTRIIITNGFKKQTDKLRPEEEDRMLFYRDIYNNLSLYK